MARKQARETRTDKANVLHWKTFGAPIAENHCQIFRRCDEVRDTLGQRKNMLARLPVEI